MVVTNKVSTYYNFCPECNGHIILLKTEGETVCSQCGLILSERELDRSNGGPRSYQLNEKEKAVSHGWPITPMVPDIELCTIVRKSETPDSNLKRVISQNSILSWKTRNMLIAITELKRICFNTNIPTHVKNKALKLYKKCYKANILRGRSITAMIAACLYYACKEMECPIFFNEIIKESSSDGVLIKKCYNLLVKTLNLDTHNVNPVHYIPRFAASLNLKPNVEQLAIKILKNFIQDQSVMGKNPKGVCAGALYLACKLKSHKIRQKDIADLIGITEITLRARYKEIIQKLQII